MLALEQQALTLGGDVGTYLAEAVHALRRGDDPVDALRLLADISSSYASRREQRNALNRVGTALSSRIRRDPHVAAERLLLEVSWLKRLTTGLAAPQGQPTDDWARPEALSALAQRRQRSEQGSRPRHDARKSEPSAKPPPARLPDSFRAKFVDLAAARGARRNRNDRRKVGREPKDVRLDLRPVDPIYDALASGLHCRTNRSQGMDEVFEGLGVLEPGQDLHFTIVEVETVATSGGKPETLARKLTLASEP
ncbi:MAG: hypothetical protein FJW96_08430 [Actinobacteria bacterium]|nr:hypothetical protein [Actinomycetota bacterium]